MSFEYYMVVYGRICSMFTVYKVLAGGRYYFNQGCSYIYNINKVSLTYLYNIRRRRFIHINDQNFNDLNFV